MELKDFVREALSQISAGIEGAQEEVRDSGGYANPAHRPSIRFPQESHFGHLPNGQNIFLVDFDVAVSVVEGQHTDAKAKLQVAGILNLAAGGASDETATKSNRVRFRVPLALPIDAVSEFQLKERDDKIRRNREEANAKRSRGDPWITR